MVSVERVTVRNTHVIDIFDDIFILPHIVLCPMIIQPIAVKIIYMGEVIVNMIVKTSIHCYIMSNKSIVCLVIISAKSVIVWVGIQRVSKEPT